ncbi:DUF4466 family protein [Pedobacter sp. Du54]|uniref:DUF4466 family protein n=1 Tax=Pedobacter anseongensis TaxID=3133439 RepID=UPI003099A46F
MNRFYTLLFSLVVITVLTQSCKKDDDESGSLSNQFLKRTTAPLIVGEKIEFAYAMGSTNGKLSGAEAMANIPGASGTIWEIVTHRTVNAIDITKVVGANSVTNGGTSSVSILDTNATTLRYFYVIPEAARGKELNVKFSSTTKAGETATTTTPNYRISNMDMKRLIPVVGTATGARFFSIADMKAYTEDEVNAGNLSSKIDFVYAYALTITPTTTAYNYGHSLVSPSEATYFPAGFTINPSWTKKSTAMERKLGNTFYDGQLKGDVNNSIFVDDIDLIQQEFNGSAKFALTLVADASVFMKTADGKYTALIYINSINNAGSSAIISLKRIQNF